LPLIPLHHSFEFETKSIVVTIPITVASAACSHYMNLLAKWPIIGQCWNVSWHTCRMRNFVAFAAHYECEFECVRQTLYETAITFKMLKQSEHKS